MIYPEAVWLDNGVSGGSYTGGPFRLVVHTTETEGMPKYADGKSAPHVTYDPKTGLFFQHTDFDTAARSLANPAGGVQTNRRSALQLEIICYSNKTLADQKPQRLWVGDLTAAQQTELRQFVDWCRNQYGVRSTWPGRKALSWSEANTSGFRMTAIEWNSFSGVCGHQHVPENTHWDPGAFDWNELLGEQMTPEQEAKLDALLAKVDRIERVIGIGENGDGAPILRHTETDDYPSGSNLSHFQRIRISEETVKKLAAELGD